MRWNPDNGFCLCVGHHVLNTFSAHKSPLIFAEWMKEKRGENWYNSIMLKARTVGKLTSFEKEIILKELNKQIKIFEL
jgi:hypothetical protein